MNSPKSSQQSSLDSLRTVEFRQTLRGYHIDDVDEYLERVAVEAEALQEQLRQSNERLKQAAERIAHLEQSLNEAKERPAQAAPASDQELVSDDTLQRTLLLAQKFVDETKSQAESEAHELVSKAEKEARTLIADAEAKAHSVTADTERKLREDVSRLESQRSQLQKEVEAVADHLESERNRLRSALGEMLALLDKNLPGGSSSGAHSSQADRQSSQSQPGTGTGTVTNGPGISGSAPEKDRGSDRSPTPSGFQR